MQPGRNTDWLRGKGGLILSIAVCFGNVGHKINKPGEHPDSLVVMNAHCPNTR